MAGTSPTDKPDHGDVERIGNGVAAYSAAFSLSRCA